MRRAVTTTVAFSYLFGLTGLGFSATAHAAGDSARSWGYNYYGQLGSGTTADSSTPAPVSGLSGVVAVAAGERHSLAVLSNGTVVAWGLNNFGQLGNGNNTGPDACNGSPCSKKPIPVSGLSGVVAVAVGNNNSLALRSNGTVVAWGGNFAGQLGNGTIIDSSTPVPVGGLSGVVGIAAGGSHNLALLSNGTVRAWGGNGDGELGNGNASGPDNCGGTPCSEVPIAVGGLSRVAAVAAGKNHSLAVLSNGTVRTWGWNGHGQLGNGNNTGPDNCGGDPCSVSPIVVSGLTGVVAIAGGQYHNLALRSNGGVRTWGPNSVGQLGNGTTTDSFTPVPVSGLSGVGRIAAGSGHSLALLSSGSVRAWGGNAHGQLGNGNNTGPDNCGGNPCSVSPIAVSVLSGATAIAAPSNGQYSLALIGPSQRLRVLLAGAGTGTVAGPGILCPPACSRRYPQASSLNLIARAAIGGAFAGFSGACKGTGTCRVTLGRDQIITATFGRPKGTRITKARIKKRKHTATFRFAAPGAITGFQCALVKRGHHKKQKPHFSKCRSPERYKRLKPGRYTFEVRALDILGADATPARKMFKI